MNSLLLDFACLEHGGFDLAYSFSVFTHISEAAAEACLGALHRALNPGGLLILDNANW